MLNISDLDFRVWHLKKKKFLYKNDGVSLAIDTSTNSYLMKGEISARILPIYKDKFLRDDVYLNLWTRFFDKNGIKIFSDDLILYDEKSFEVKNTSNFKPLLCRKNEKEIDVIIELSEKLALKCEILGNIHEKKTEGVKI